MQCKYVHLARIKAQAEHQDSRAWLCWMWCNLGLLHSDTRRQTLRVRHRAFGVFRSSGDWSGCDGLHITSERTTGHLAEKGRKTWRSLLPPNYQRKPQPRLTTQIIQHGLKICWVRQCLNVMAPNNSLFFLFAPVRTNYYFRNLFQSNWPLENKYCI